MTPILLGDDMTEAELAEVAREQRALIAAANDRPQRRRAGQDYWTARRVARMSDDALYALLNSGEITEADVAAIEAEQDARDYDASDPCSQQNSR